MSAINKVNHSAPALILAFAIGASVNLLVYELAQRFLRSDLPEKEARPIAIVASMIGCSVGVYQCVDDKMIALAFLLGIAAAAVFSIWSYHRSKASE